VSYAGSVSSHTSNLPEESFLASRVRDAVLHNIRTEAHPKNTIQLQLLILQSDGGELAACIQAVNFVMFLIVFRFHRIIRQFFCRS
jgi:ribonuclease PH